MLRFAATRTEGPRARAELDVCSVDRQAEGRRARTRRLARRLIPLVVGAAACVGACYSNEKGIAPPDNGIYFPTGLALSQPNPDGASGSRWLFVLNSNFDLRYDAGWISAIDLNAVQSAIDTLQCNVHPNAAADAKGTQDCSRSDPSQFIKSSVRVGTFGADLVATQLYKNQSDGTSTPLEWTKGRLLAPVRGDATMTIVDWQESGNDITLYCAPGAQKNSFGTTCAGAWRIGDNSSANTRQLTLEGEPFSIAVPSAKDWTTSDSDAEPRHSGGIAAIVHQSQGDVSVFTGVNVASDVGVEPGTKLVYTLGGGAMPPGGTSIVALDLPDQTPFTPRFLVTNQTQSSVFQLSYFGDNGTSGRSALFIEGAIPIPTNNGGYDSRGIVVDPPNDGETRPIRVFLTNRTPPSIVVGERDPLTKGIRFYSNIALPIGPSRITRAVVAVPGSPTPKTRIYATSFDGLWLTVIDPDRVINPVVDVIRTGRGPYAMAIDSARKLGFVTSFTESTVQVIQLSDDPSLTDSYQQVIFTIGVPQLPRF
jgi:hypothetical protein